MADSNDDSSLINTSVKPMTEEEEIKTGMVLLEQGVILVREHLAHLRENLHCKFCGG